MKIALYISDGLEQIILTPEDDSEKAILTKLNKDSITVTFKQGQFYAGRDNLMHSAPAGYSHAYDSTYIYLRKSDAKSE